MNLYSAPLSKISVRFTSVSLVMGPVHSSTNPTPWGAYSPAAIKALITIQTHKQLPSNQVPIFTHGSRERTYRWSALPKDTASHHCSRDLYSTFLDPKYRAVPTAPWRHAWLWSIHSDIGTRASPATGLEPGATGWREARRSRYQCPAPFRIRIRILGFGIGWDLVSHSAISSVFCKDRYILSTCRRTVPSVWPLQPFPIPALTDCPCTSAFSTRLWTSSCIATVTSQLTSLWWTWILTTQRTRPQCLPRQSC